MGYPLIFKVICIQWSFCSRCWCHFFRFDWKKRSLEDMPNCCFCSPYLFYVTEQTYASSMGSPKPPSLFPSFIRRHTFLTENWLLTHDSVVSFRRVCVFWILLLCVVTLTSLLIHSTQKAFDDRGGSSYKINLGSTGPPGYQVQLLGILMD